MANNLFITYDLNKAGKNYEGVFEAIKSLGSIWSKYQKSAWFVVSDYSPTQARDLIKAQMDNDDSLMVVQAIGGAWSISPDQSDYIHSNWQK